MNSGFHNSRTLSQCRLPPRHGFSLLETMIVVTILGAVMTIAMTGISRLFLAQSRELQALAEAGVWQRLSRDFRTDAHRADSAALDPAGRLNLHTDSDRVMWSMVSDGIQRVQTESDSGRTMALELYRLPAADVAFTINTTGRRPIVRMAIDRAGDVYTRPTAGQLEAVVGLTHRFQKSHSSGARP